MADALWLHEELFAFDLVGFGFEDLTQAGEVISVAMGDDEASICFGWSALVLRKRPAR